MREQPGGVPPAFALALVGMVIGGVGGFLFGVVNTSEDAFLPAADILEHTFVGIVLGAFLMPLARPLWHVVVRRDRGDERR